MIMNRKHIAWILVPALVVGMAGTSLAADQAQDKGKDKAHAGHEDVLTAEEAGQRGTPPWTNDAANRNNEQPRQTVDQDDLPTHAEDFFKIRPEWKKTYRDPSKVAGHEGKKVYAHICQACHMENGQGASGGGDYPSFVGDERLRNAEYPIGVILHGLRGMPAFEDMLSDAQVAAVVNYLRTDFGNQLKADVTADDVKRVRDAGS